MDEYAQGPFDPVNLLQGLDYDPPDVGAADLDDMNAEGSSGRDARRKQLGRYKKLKRDYEALLAKYKQLSKQLASSSELAMDYRNLGYRYGTTLTASATTSVAGNVASATYSRTINADFTAKYMILRTPGTIGAAFTWTSLLLGGQPLVDGNVAVSREEPLIRQLPAPIKVGNSMALSMTGYGIGAAGDTMNPMVELLPFRPAGI